jgi:very-short-patch-repair endonuclease
MLPYNPILEEQARYMKLNLSKADTILEGIIKKNFPGIAFEIKIPVDDYILDFLFPEKMFAIEIDSSQQENMDAYVYHAERKEKLESLGLIVLRIEEKEILNNKEELTAKIIEIIKA